MAKLRKNEPTAAKRRVKLFIVLDDGVTPAPAATDWTAQKAVCPLTGTHSATVRAVAAGAAGNLFTFTTVADGSGAGHVTNSGNHYVYHYASGVTTMTNVSTVLPTAGGVLELVGGTFTGSDVLTDPGDTQGPLAFSGGYDQAWQVTRGGVAFFDAAGVWTNMTASNGDPIDGAWQYEFTQAETNYLVSELQVMVLRPANAPAAPTGFGLVIETCEMNDAEDFAAIDENGNLYGDTHRLQTAMMAGVAADFGTGVIVWKSLDGSKTRNTGTTDGNARLTSTQGDLTP